jgi:predicted nucleotidyltransferase
VADRTHLDLPVPELQMVLRILATHVPDRPVYAFGSRVAGNARRRSDLDLAIGGTAPLPLRTRAALADEFSQSDLSIRVDVVDLNAITPEFRKRIERDFVPVKAEPVQSEAANA